MDDYTEKAREILEGHPWIDEAVPEARIARAIKEAVEEERRKARPGQCPECGETVEMEGVPMLIGILSDGDLLTYPGTDKVLAEAGLKIVPIN